MLRSTNNVVDSGMLSCDHTGYSDKTCRNTPQHAAQRTATSHIVHVVKFAREK